MKVTEDIVAIKEIITALKLDEPFTALDDKNPNDASMEFQKIAKKLFEEYQIAKGNTRYDFEEIEFYLYTEKHKDNNHVYPRLCQAGEWFVHYSGVDLTFQTLLEDKKITQCGGILIRRIKKVGEESVGGPLRCLMELFNGQEEPILVKKQKQEIRFDATPRIGIKNNNVQDERQYRFIVNENTPIKTCCPQYTKDGIVIKPKCYTYNPK